MSENAAELQSLELLSNAYKFDATPTVTTVDQLQQYYLFMPLQVKACYLAYVLATKGPYANDDESSDDESNDATLGTQKHHTSAIVFTSTCKSCQTLAVMLEELNIPCVALHSMMTQHRRMAALGKFKSSLVGTIQNISIFWAC
jgi:ATP-dependent RNA helicase DDX49/DBP8